MQPSRDIARLIEIVQALREPLSGCAWDREQTFETIVPYTIEEAYEIADAVARGDMADLREELGDLLLQVVFQSRIAEEHACFDFGAVVEAITQKMIRGAIRMFSERRVTSPLRCGRPFGAPSRLRKKPAKEEAERGPCDANGIAKEASHRSLLDDVPIALPGLTRAVKLQAKAASVGFDWNDARLVLEKIREETAELKAALEQGKPSDIEDEIGDLLFAVANLARHVQTDPEAAVRRANGKFKRRFRFIESELARKGKTPAAAGLNEMETLWNVAKQWEVQAQDAEQHVECSLDGQQQERASRALSAAKKS